jgi:hypothetical protein
MNETEHDEILKKTEDLVRRVDELIDGARTEREAQLGERHDRKA